MRRAGLLLLALLVAAQAAQAQRTYTGREAQALKCAWIFSKTAAVLERADMITVADLETSLTVSARILQFHVGGSEREKLAAFAAVGARRDDAQTLGEFQRESRSCLVMFPVE